MVQVSKENNIPVAITLENAAEYARQVGAAQSLMQTFVTNTERLGAVGKMSGTALAETFAKAHDRAAALNAEAKALPLSLSKAAEEAKKLQDNTTGTGAGGGISLSAFRMAARAANQLNLPGAEVARTVGEAGELIKVVGELAPALSAAGVSTVALTVALGPIILIAGAVAVAFLAVSKSLEEGKAKAEFATEAIKKYYEAIEEGTTASIIAQIKQNERDTERLQLQKDAALAALDRINNDPNTSPLQKLLSGISGEAKAYQDTVDKLDPQIKQLQADFEGLYKALDSTSVAANDAAAANEKLIGRFISLTKQNLEGFAKQAGETWATIQKDTEDRNKRIASVQQKYNDDIHSINEKDYQARTDLAKKFADQQVAIAEKALADANNALAKLLQEQAKLKLDFDRGEAQAERKQLFDDNTVKIKAQVEETKALQTHLQELQDIQTAARRRERDFLLNRNFLGLYLSQQQTTDDLADSNKKFVQTQKDATDALKQQTNETARQRAFEQNERLIAYQERLADAQSQYKRELVQLDANKKAQLALLQRTYNSELTALSNKTIQELALKRAGYVQELSLAAQSSAARVRIEAETQAALLRQAAATLSSVQQNAMPAFSSVSTTGQTITRFAAGGPVRAGQRSHVNEPGSSGNEGFGSLRFPGEGIFMPFHSGSVNPDMGGGNVIHASFVIHDATNPDKVARVVAQKLQQMVGS